MKLSILALSLVSSHCLVLLILTKASFPIKSVCIAPLALIFEEFETKLKGIFPFLPPLDYVDPLNMWNFSISLLEPHVKLYSRI